METRKLRLSVLFITSICLFLSFINVIPVFAKDGDASPPALSVDQRSRDLTDALINGRVYHHVVAYKLDPKNREILVMDETKKISSYFDAHDYIPSKDYFKSNFKDRRILLIKFSATTMHLFIYYQQ